MRLGSLQRPHAFRREQVDQADQRQADQGRRIIAGDAREQRDPEPFRLDRAGAVERLFSVEVCLERGVFEMAKAADDVDQRVPAYAGTRIEQRHCGMKDDRMPTHRLKKLEGVAGIARLAHGLAAKFGHLVGTDDQGVRMLRRDRARLRLREPDCCLRRPLAWDRCFVDLGSDDGERQPEAFQQGGKQFFRYKFDVFNKDQYPAEMFAAAPNLPPCGLNTKSSRTWIDIFDSRGKRLYGFCAISKPADLNQLWFALEQGMVPPSYIYIEMNDRQTNTKYKSNLADTSE